MPWPIPASRIGILPGSSPTGTIGPSAASIPSGVLQLAKDLGGPSIQTEPGGPLEEGQSWQAAARIFYDEIMPCVALAEKLEVFLLIEPEPGLLIERMEQYLEFAGRIDSPWVGLNFDIGHAYCVGEDPQDWIRGWPPIPSITTWRTFPRRANIAT